MYKCIRSAEISTLQQKQVHHYPRLEHKGCALVLDAGSCCLSNCEPLRAVWAALEALGC